MILLSCTDKLKGLPRLALVLFSAMLLLLSACENDDKNNSPIDKGDDETTITFSVSAPNDFSPTSYALSENEEKTVSTVDVLLFKDGNYFSGPHYGILNGSDVTIRIPSAAENYNMAVFANCRAELNQVFSTSSSKADVLESLTRTVAEGNADSGKIGGTDAGWLTTDGNKTIPMYGEYTAGQTVNLVRMLARINVTIASEDKDGKPITVPFTLSEVYLCNYNSEGQIAPASNWTESTPTVVPSVQQTTFAKSIKYTAVADNKLEREIYTFEANAGDADNLPTNTCLVIGGEYNSSGTTTYYRIDFVNTAGNYLPLLRNHTYETVISKIGGSGYSSPESAFNSRPVNIEYDIVDWDGSEVVNVVYDGQYMLGVSQNSFTFDKSERTASSADNTLTVTTNFPTWSVSIHTQSPSGWLTATKSGSTVRLDCGTNSTGSSRTATVRITAGRMVQDISVTQIKDAVSISFGGDVSGDELYFESKAGTAPSQKNFILSWTPSGTTPTYTSNFTTGTINNSSLSSSGTVSQSSGVSVPVKPTAISVSDFNSGITERTSVVTYQLSYGGATVNKILKIRQKATVDAPTIAISGNDVVNGELYFESKAGEAPSSAKTFTLSWSPTSVSPTYTNSFTSSYGTVDGSSLSSSGSVSKASGSSFSVKPTAISTADHNNGNSERTFVITYQLTNGGYTVSKDLRIRQRSLPIQSLPVRINAASYYPRTNTRERFFITSTSGSVAWVVKNVQLLSGASFSMSNINTTSGTATSTTSTNAGNIVEFTPDNTPDSNVKARVTIGSPTGAYTDISVDLNIGGERIINTSPSQVVWAGSNIYWNGSNLTFDASKSSSDITANERKQGVFFQWGSLWGISPIGSWGSSTDVYPPAGGTQKANVAPISSSWSNIPLAPAAGVDASDRAYLYEQTGSTASEGIPSQPIGDICKWLTDKGWAPGSKTGTRWRMPTGDELGLGTTSTDDTKTKFSIPPDNALVASPEWTNLTSTGTITDVTGQGSVPLYQGRWNTQVSTKPYFPASGYRDIVNGTLYFVGASGYCWTGSPGGASASILNFSSTTARLNLISRSNAFSVRCVQEN